MPKTERAAEGIWRVVGNKKWNLTINRSRKRSNYSGFSDAKLTARLRSDLLRALERHDAGEAIQTKGLTKRALEILADLGVIKPQRHAELLELIEEYRGVLLARNCCEDHTRAACTRITRIIEGCGFTKPADIEADQVSTFLHKIRTRKKKPIGISTSNHYREALIAFANWLIDQELLATNPLRTLKKLNAKADIRRKRRPIDNPDFALLIRATLRRKTRRQLSNEDRVIVYKVSRATGFRAAEVASLTPASFHLDAGPPVAVVEAKTSKHKREDRQVIPSWLVAELRPLMDRPRQERLWPGKWYRRAAEMLAEDLEAAGLPVEDEEGRKIDFHALRHTFISGLARAGVHPKEAQKLARHSTIQLTMETYTHVEEERLAEVVEGIQDPSRILPRIPTGDTGGHEGAPGSTREG